MNVSSRHNAPPPHLTLQQQRMALRTQLASQRLIIESQLGPVRAENTRQFPRSNIMRFFSQRPELMKKILGMVIGASFIKSMHPVLTLAKLLHSRTK